jgi:hypothetical protein
MAATTIISDITKEIKFDRQTKDYACYISIDGAEAECIGFASTYSQAETKCNQYAYDYLSDTGTHKTAAELVLADDAPAAPAFTMEEKDTDWFTYRYGTAQLDVEEEPDGTVKHLTFLIDGREVYFKGSDLPAVRDLASLLHNHHVQNTLEFTLGIGSQPAPLTLSHFEPTYTRDRFDNGCIHEYEAALCLAMARMGLSEVAQRDLFGHVLEIADAISTQQRMDGYRDGLDAAIREKTVKARRTAA